MQMRSCVVLIVFLMTRSAVAERAKLPELAIPGALGVNIHFTDPRPGEMKMLADAGLKWVRMDFAWGVIEREKGKYDFSAYDRLLENLKPHGIRAVFILDYANRLYDGGLSPHTDEGRAAMAAFAVAAVTHFKDNGIVWEMWNEPNIKQFWKPVPSADDYAKLALAVGKAIRAAATDELFVGPATSTIDLKFLETCFKAGCLEYWDAVSVHPYRQKDPETAGEEYRKLRLLIAKYAPKEKKIPILSGEWGYSSAWKNFDEDRQGKYLPREFLVNLYNEVPISIWYDWHDDGVDPKEGEHHFGTVHNTYKKDAEEVYDPKPAYVAMKTLAQTLGGFQYNKRLAMEKAEDWVLLFNKGDEVTLAVWTTGKMPHEVTIPASPGEFQITDYLGKTIPAAKAGNKGLTITISDNVQYLVPSMPNDLLRTASACDRAPLEVLKPGPGIAEIELNLRNPLDRSLSMTMNAFPLAVVGPNQSRQLSAAATVSRSPDPKTISFLTTIDGLGSFSQMTQIIASNPLKVTVLPQAGEDDRSLFILVDDPMKKSEAYSVRLRDVGKGMYWPEGVEEYNLKPGTIAGYRSVEMGCSMTGSFTTGVEVKDAQGRLVFNLPRKTYYIVTTRSLEWVNRDTPDAFRVAADGDPSVHSTQSVSIEKTARSPASPPFVPQHALKISYNFDPGWRFLELKTSEDEINKITGKPKELGLWLYGDNSNHALRLRFIDATGQTFQPTGPNIDFKGWKYLTIPMQGDNLAHWGKGDGEIHYPIHWDSLLLLDNVSREKSAGEIWVTGMTLVE